MYPYPRRARPSIFFLALAAVLALGAAYYMHRTEDEFMGFGEGRVSKPGTFSMMAHAVINFGLSFSSFDLITPLLFRKV